MRQSTKGFVKLLSSCLHFGGVQVLQANNICTAMHECLLVLHYVSPCLRSETLSWNWLLSPSQSSLAQTAGHTFKCSKVPVITHCAAQCYCPLVLSQCFRGSNPVNGLIKGESDPQCASPWWLSDIVIEGGLARKIVFLDSC